MTLDLRQRILSKAYNVKHEGELLVRIDLTHTDLENLSTALQLLEGMVFGNCHCTSVDKCAFCIAKEVIK